MPFSAVCFLVIFVVILPKVLNRHFIYIISPILTNIISKNNVQINYLINVRSKHHFRLIFKPRLLLLLSCCPCGGEALSECHLAGASRKSATSVVLCSSSSGGWRVLFSCASYFLMKESNLLCHRSRPRGNDKFTALSLLLRFFLFFLLFFGIVCYFRMLFNVMSNYEPSAEIVQVIYMAVLVQM